MRPARSCPAADPVGRREATTRQPRSPSPPVDATKPMFQCHAHPSRARSPRARVRPRRPCSAASARRHRQQFGKSGQHPRAGFDQDDARSTERRSICRKSCRKVRCATSAMAPAISTPVAPPPTMTNVSNLPPLGVVFHDLGALKGHQEAPPGFGRVGNVFQSGGGAQSSWPK